MKTLTELSGSVIRTAAAAIADARRLLPREEKPAEPVVADSAADAAGEAVAVAAAPAPKPERHADSEAVKAALGEAVARPPGSRATGWRCWAQRSRPPGGVPAMFAWSGCSASRRS